MCEGVFRRWRYRWWFGWRYDRRRVGNKITLLELQPFLFDGCMAAIQGCCFDNQLYERRSAMWGNAWGRRPASKLLILETIRGLSPPRGASPAWQAKASLKLHSTHSTEEFVIDPATILRLLQSMWKNYIILTFEFDPC